MSITLSGRRFSLIEGLQTPPSRGDYVAYGSSFFPVTQKTGYPLSVVADIAAKVSRKIVLVPGDEILAFLSGTRRVIATNINPAATDEHEKSEFHKTLLRLTLLSDHKEVLSLGEIPLLGNTPCEKIELSELNLPPVIRRSRSWLMLGLVLAIVISSIVAGLLIKSGVKKQAEDLNIQLANAETHLSQLLTEVKSGRAQLNSPSPTPTTNLVISNIELPAPKESFMSAFYESGSPSSNQVRVINGSIKY